MKIVLTTGGTGGHFYPIIAVAEELRAIAQESQEEAPDLYYLSNEPYDEAYLKKNNITFMHVGAGKMRIYFSLSNIKDLMKIVLGLPRALFLLYKLWPDVVFSKGSYASVPVILAARILQIPVFVHDSDAVPGRANIMAGKFAERIGISYPEAKKFFARQEAVALVGNPVRKGMQHKIIEGSHEHFGLDPARPTILVLGGSQGADHINNAVLQAAKDLLPRYQIIHQVGKALYESFKETAFVQEKVDPNFAHYHIYPFFDAETMCRAAGVANLVISRAGSSAIFELSQWELPAILIPIPEDVSRDQRNNAYAYSRTGAAEVIEQENFKPHVLTHEIDRIMSDTASQERMREGARNFAMPDAARTIAQEILRIGHEHNM